MRKISNSEVNTWLHCTRKYWYEYVLDLEPKVQSGPLTKGNLIHAMLEQYYLEKMDGSDEQTCRKAMVPVVMEAGNSGDLDIVEVGKVRDLVEQYLNHYLLEDERYEIVAVETKVNAPMMDGPDGFTLAGTIDSIWLDTETGEHIPVDHKSSYNFWTDDQATISGQFPKYMYALRERGFNVSKFMINQIRTREMKNGEFFRRTWIRPSETRIRNIIAQHVMVGTQIMEFRRDPIKEATIPIYDKYGCANCPFLALCDSDSEGAPTEYMIASEFQTKKNYGYNVEAPE